MAIPIEKKGLRKGDGVVAGSPGGGREWVDLAGEQRSGKQQREVKGGTGDMEGAQGPA